MKAQYRTINNRTFNSKAEAIDYEDLCFAKWFRNHPQIDICKLYLNDDDDDDEYYFSNKTMDYNVARRYWERYVVRL